MLTKDIVIGQWADYFNYDPDGIAGEPTPRNEKFERMFFGDWVVDLLEEKRARSRSAVHSESDER